MWIQEVATRLNPLYPMGIIYCAKAYSLSSQNHWSTKAATSFMDGPLDFLAELLGIPIIFRSFPLHNFSFENLDI